MPVGASENWLGTERVRTDYLGRMATTEWSLAFGDNFTQNVFDSGGDADNNHFAGQEYDAESGSQHAQFRQYSSTEGRWMSPDPYDGSYDFGNPQSMNRYAYALNNPLSLVDPSGLDEAAPDPGDSGGSDLSDSPGAAPTATGGLPGLLKYLLSQLGGALGDLGSLFGGGGGSFGGGLSDGISGGGGISQPAGIPMTLGYQNIARPAQQNTGEGSTSNVQKRDALAAAAGDQYHSTKWNPKGGYSQCNVFVCAMIDKVGLDGPRNDNGHAITAGQWADPKFAINNWRVLGSNEAVAPGDVAAVAMPGAFSNASGHMGIVSDLEGGVPHIMAAGSQHVYRTSAANFEPNYTIVYRRYVGQ